MTELITEDKLSLGKQKEVLIKDLKDIGFSPNEAKVYLALLPLESSTASNLVTLTGIRDSKIYQILDRLKKKGLVSTQEGVPREYKPLNPVEALETFQAQIQEEYEKKMSKFHRLTTVLPPMYQEHEDSPKLAYIIKGKKNVLNQAKRLIEDARTSIVLMMPDIEIFHLLESTISQIEGGNKDLTIGLYDGNIPAEMPSSPQFYLTPCECFFIIIDDKLLLTVSNWKNNNWHAIWTTEKSLIEVSTGYFSSSCCLYDGCNQSS